MFTPVSPDFPPGDPALHSLYPYWTPRELGKPAPIKYLCPGIENEFEHRGIHWELSLEGVLGTDRVIKLI